MATLCLLPVVLLVSQAAAQADEFAMANEFYQKKDYSSAVRLYLSVLNQGVESANLYFNLGNACFKDGDLGHAVFYYLRARRLSPDDQDIVHNLEFVRQFSRVQMEGVELNPIRTFFAGLVESHRLNTLAWLSSTFFVLFILVLCVRYGLGFSNFVVRIGAVVSLVLLLVSSGLTTFKYRNDYLTRRAVIITEDANVHTGPSEQSDVELEGAPGLTVQIISETVDYYDVLFENKRRGWIKKDQVAVL
jgi:tetratricopeptide (TPR) repeat protein